MHLLINNEKFVDVALRVYEFTNVPNVEHVAKDFKNTLPTPSPLYTMSLSHKIVTARTSVSPVTLLCLYNAIPHFHKAIFVLGETRNSHRAAGVSVPHPAKKKKIRNICYDSLWSDQRRKANAILRAAAPSSERRRFLS